MRTVSYWSRFPSYVVGLVGLQKSCYALTLISIATTRTNDAISNLSASSSITILCRPGGKVTFFCANPFIRFLTTSIPVPDLCQHWASSSARNDLPDLVHRWHSVQEQLPCTQAPVVALPDKGWM